MLHDAEICSGRREQRCDGIYGTLGNAQENNANAGGAAEKTLLFGKLIRRRGDADVPDQLLIELPATLGNTVSREFLGNIGIHRLRCANVGFPV